MAARSLLIDQLLTLGWEQFGLAHEHRLSLIAVGGYGRGELHPNSDIDILILSPEPLPKAVGETIGQFLTLLWDLKLEVGHAVRSVHECVDQGKQDITIATNLLEARLITGPGHLCRLESGYSARAALAQRRLLSRQAGRTGGAPSAVPGHRLHPRARS